MFITILDRFAWSTNADDSLVKLRPGIPPTLAVRFVRRVCWTEAKHALEFSIDIPVLRFSFVEHCLYLRSHEKPNRLRGEPRRSRKRLFIKNHKGRGDREVRCSRRADHVPSFLNLDTSLVSRWASSKVNAMKRSGTVTRTCALVSPLSRRVFAGASVRSRLDSASSIANVVIARNLFLSHN